MCPFWAPANRRDSTLSIATDMMLESKMNVHRSVPEASSHTYDKVTEISSLHKVTSETYNIDTIAD